MRVYCVLLVIAVILFSLNSIAGVEIEKDFQIGYQSKYIGGANGMTIYDDQVFQQSINLSVACKSMIFYSSLWSSYSPQQDFNSDWGDEIDLCLGFEKTFNKVTVGLGYSYYLVWDIGESKGNLHGIVFSLSLPKVPFVQPYISLEEDIPTDKETLEGGLVYKVGIKSNFKLPGFLHSQEINWDLSLFGQDGCYGTVPENINAGRLNISSDFKIWKFIFSPSVDFVKRLGYKPEQGGMSKDRIRWGSNLKIPF